ncbi:MAG: O-antigen ligase family protein [Myxococcota bacterium]|nr:O-antigen ligase family protein [Myxococcota bacterium]
MDAINYLALAGAIVTFVLLLVAPRWGMPALVAISPLLQVATPRAGPGLNAETALYTAALFSLAMRARPALPPPAFLAPYLAFLAVMLLAALIAATSLPIPGSLGVRLWEIALPLKSELWPTLGLFLFFGLAPDEQQRRRLLFAMTIAVLVAAVSSFIWPAGRADFVSPQRLTGFLYQNPNALGSFLAIFSVIPLSAIFRQKTSPALRIFSLMVYVTAVTAVVLTQSRGAWIAYVVGHLVWLFYVNRRLFVPAVIVIALMVASILAAGLTPRAISERVEQTLKPGSSLFRASDLTGGLDSSAQVRVVILRVAGDMWLDSPVWGHGFRSFYPLSAEYGHRYGLLRGRHRNWTGGVSAHSLYARTTAEDGLIGLAVLGWFAWVLIGTGRSLVAGKGPERDLGVTFLAVLAGTGAMCLTMEALRSHQTSIPFWALSGLAIRALYDEAVRRNATAKPGAAPGSRNAAPLRPNA